MHRYISAISLILILIPLSTRGAAFSGKGLYGLGNSPSAAGRGSTAVSSSGFEYFMYNPASAAGSDRGGVSLMYAFPASGFHYPGVAFGFPTAYGTLAGSFRHLTIGNPEDISTAWAFSLGGGKNITPKMAFGAGLNIIAGTSSEGESFYYPGVTLGSRYCFSGMPRTMGLGIFSPSVGAALSAGFPGGSIDSGEGFNGITAGYEFSFFRHALFELCWHNDITLFNYNEGFPIKAGIESEFRNGLILRTGAILFNEYGCSSITAGAGYRFKTAAFTGSVDYTASYGAGSVVHFVGITASYGSPDREPPKAEISPETAYISPNHDGTRDYIEFSLNVTDRSLIKGWRLQILGENSSGIREFRMSERDIIKPLTPSLFVKRIFSSSISLDVPRTIIWDGTNPDGSTAKDGVYTYSFSVWDEHDNMAPKKTGTIILDNTPPAVQLKDHTAMFSPNSDGRKDLFRTKLESSTSPSDIWTASIKDSLGNTVKEFTWQGASLPSELIWDGLTDAGLEAPDGVYSLTISASDMAGNTSSAEINDIVLTRSYQAADIRIESLYLSHRISNSLRMFPSLSSTSGLESYSAVISDNDGDPVKEISGTAPLPAVISWSCTDNNNEKLKDGTYSVKLTAAFNSGNTPSSFPKKLIVDSTPPNLKVTHSPERFSPDNDGENDILTIKPDCYDKSPVDSWAVRIVSPAGTIFKTFTGKGAPPAEIKWDGLGDNLDIVESAADYGIEFSATDAAGNTSTVTGKPIKVDILVVVTERGLKMRISNIQFAFDSDVLRPSGMRVLDRVIDILNSYQNYDIVIEGHTDDIGEDSYNLTLSEKRAKSVYDYLSKKGISRERLDFIGLGETVPQYPNTNEENRRRNRRVEFLLMKIHK